MAMPQSRVLQREHVVDAVARHRDDVAARLQRPDHRPLLVRCDAAEHGRRLDRVGELLVVVGQVARVDEVRLPGSPTRLPTAPTVRGLSPEITFSVTPCSAKYASVSVASGRT